MLFSHSLHCLKPAILQLLLKQRWEQVHFILFFQWCYLCREQEALSSYWCNSQKYKILLGSPEKIWQTLIPFPSDSNSFTRLPYALKNPVISLNMSINSCWNTQNPWKVLQLSTSVSWILTISKQTNSLESQVLFCCGIYKHSKGKSIYFLRWHIDSYCHLSSHCIISLAAFFTVIRISNRILSSNELIL